MGDDVRERLARLAGLLFSDIDGEVVAAARAIRRVLDAEGRTPHDFMAMVAGGAASDDEDYRRNVLEMILKILSGTGSMRDRELQFVQQMRNSLAASPDFRMTTKQASWLVSLYNRYGGK